MLNEVRVKEEIPPVARLAHDWLSAFLEALFSLAGRWNNVVPSWRFLPTTVYNFLLQSSTSTSKSSIFSSNYSFLLQHQSHQYCHHQHRHHQHRHHQHRHHQHRLYQSFTLPASQLYPPLKFRLSLSHNCLIAAFQLSISQLTTFNFFSRRFSHRFSPFLLSLLLSPVLPPLLTVSPIASLVSASPTAAPAVDSAAPSAAAPLVATLAASPVAFPAISFINFSVAFLNAASPASL